MTSSMNPPICHYLFGVHCIRIKCCHFLRGNIWVFSSFEIYFLVLILSLIKSDTRLIELIFRINSCSLSLEKIVLSLVSSRSVTGAIISISWRTDSTSASTSGLAHEILNLIILRDIDGLVLSGMHRSIEILWGHHASSHYNIWVPFLILTVSLLSSIIIVWLDHIDCIILMIIYYLLLLRRNTVFSSVVISSILRRSNSSVGCSWKASCFTLVSFISGSLRLWMHINLLI